MGGVILSYFSGGRNNDELKKKPCHKCPYTLGLIQTVKNPCPQCKINNYQSYKWFQIQLSGVHPDMEKKK